MPDASDPSQTTSRPKYHAVITYVPDEFIWCDWLHRQLDGITVPPDLANQRTKHGFTRPAAVQVFPDPRNPAHLARHATSPPPSRHLIVICTPHSAGSAAIEEQIRAFKRSEGEDRIVVLVADGDPEHDDAPAGADDAAWLPTWLRWRLDKKGNFRPAEASEPQIVDARADKLSPPEARAHLLAALLDVPREVLRAHGDLISAAASDTLVPAGGDVPVAAVAPPRRGAGGIIVAGLIITAAAGAYWWTTQPGADPNAPAATVATSTPVATPEPTPSPKPATPSPRPTTPKPKPAATPAAKPSAAPTPGSPASSVVKAAASPAAKPSPTAPPLFIASSSGKRAPVTSLAPLKKGPTAFSPSEGPQTPITTGKSAKPGAAPPEPGSSWQRMRDLGDTLIERDNRDAGLIALSQAAEVGLRSAVNASATEKLDVARLCFRVGALQKQFGSAGEARRLLESARALLGGVRGESETAAERDSLVSGIDQLLRSLPR